MKTGKYFLNFLRLLALRVGVSFQRATRKKDLEKLLNLIKPMDSQYQLVRVGGPGDGGYLIPDDLGGVSHLFSPGVGNSIDFEKDLFLRYGIKSHLIDASVSPIVDESVETFDQLFLGSTVGKISYP